MPDRLDECLEHGWWISFAGNVTYPKARDLAARPSACPLDRLLVETDAPYLTPQAVRKERNQPAYVAHTARFVAERARRSPTRSSRRPSTPTPRGCSAGERARRARAAAACGGCATFGDPPQARARPELPHRLEHPRRDRARRRARRRTTSCSRSAAASACSASTSPRASRTCTSSSSTARSSRALRDALDPLPQRARCTSPTRVKLDLAALDPPPTKVVANLPYGIAATVDPAHDRGAAAGHPLGGDGAEGGRRAVRRARRAAAPTACPRCSPSSPATCACCAPSRARSSIPVPNVDSVLVGLTRRGAGARRRRCARSCSRAFAHRRKALARSLAPRAGRGPALRDARARRARGARPPGRRARRAARARGACATLATRTRAAMRRDRAALAPGEDQPLPVRRPAARRRPPRARSRSCSRSRSPTSCALEPARPGDARRGRLRGRRRARTSPPARSPPSAPRAAGTGRRCG